MGECWNNDSKRKTVIASLGNYATHCAKVRGKTNGRPLAFKSFQHSNLPLFHDSRRYGMILVFFFNYETREKREKNCSAEKELSSMPVFRSFSLKKTHAKARSASALPHNASFFLEMA